MSSSHGLTKMLHLMARDECASPECVGATVSYLVFCSGVVAAAVVSLSCFLFFVNCMMNDRGVADGDTNVDDSVAAHYNIERSRVS